MKGLFAALVLPALCGCVTIVRVCPEDATVVQARAIGLSVAPRNLSLGLSSTQVIAIPADTCGVAIVENPTTDSGPFWRKISDRTRAHCLTAKD